LDVSLGSCLKGKLEEFQGETMEKKLKEIRMISNRVSEVRLRG